MAKELFEPYLYDDSKITVAKGSYKFPTGTTPPDVSKKLASDRNIVAISSKELSGINNQAALDPQIAMLYEAAARGHLIALPKNALDLDAGGMSASAKAYAKKEIEDFIQFIKNYNKDNKAADGLREPFKAAFLKGLTDHHAPKKATLPPPPAPAATKIKLPEPTDYDGKNLAAAPPVDATHNFIPPEQFTRFPATIESINNFMEWIYTQTAKGVSIALPKVEHPPGSGTNAYYFNLSHFAPNEAAAFGMIVKELNEFNNWIKAFNIDNKAVFPTHVNPAFKAAFDKGLAENPAMKKKGPGVTIGSSGRSGRDFTTAEQTALKTIIAYLQTKPNYEVTATSNLVTISDKASKTILFTIDPNQISAASPTNTQETYEDMIRTALSLFKDKLDAKDTLTVDNLDAAEVAKFEAAYKAVQADPNYAKDFGTVDIKTIFDIKAASPTATPTPPPPSKITAADVVFALDTTDLGKRKDMMQKILNGDLSHLFTITQNGSDHVIKLNGDPTTADSKQLIRWIKTATSKLLEGTGGTINADDAKGEITLNKAAHDLLKAPAVAADPGAGVATLDPPGATGASRSSMTSRR